MTDLGPVAPTGGARLSIRQAAFIGIGAMVGAGIFSLLGAAGEVAGAAVWVSFLLAGLVAVALAGRALALSPFAALVITVLASLLIGLEASSLRRWTYGCRGKPARDAVIAGSHEEAELKAAARWLDAVSAPDIATAGAAAPAATRPSQRRDDAVIGLFPASEGGR